VILNNREVLNPATGLGVDILRCLS